MAQTPTARTDTDSRLQKTYRYLWFFVALAVFMAALLYTATFALAFDHGAELAALNGEIAALSDERNELRCALAANDSAAAIAARAEALGMVRAEGEDYLYYLSQ